ncbi:hypothetical protein [Spirillospora sp. NPDC048824]|uniref:hypothetical protein n=1 Tax=Spirillospora sp. NPDC048824 TaxID=3364526 RepID=UPI0037122C87
MLPGDTETWSDRQGSHSSTTGRLVAYSLADGERVWISEFSGEVLGLTGDGRNVTVITSGGDRVARVRVR